MNRRIYLLFVLAALAAPDTSAQTAVSSRLYQFSPIAEIITRNLGLQDKNGNGVIDKNAGEGYEKFIETYGTGNTFAEKEQGIDCGFFANSVIYGDGNGKLEENEIVNHYYVNIRFKPEFTQETRAIEDAIKSYVYTNNIPLIWQDDRYGTVMSAVNKILGAGWQFRQVSADAAIEMFDRVAKSLEIRELRGDPNVTGYFLMPELIIKKTVYCFDVTQFAFWFFSQLRLNSIANDAVLYPGLAHEIIKLTGIDQTFDYFGQNKRYQTDTAQWYIRNPLQSLSEYYVTQEGLYNKEQAAIYNKYQISTIAILMNAYVNQTNPDYQEIISLGEFILANIDVKEIMSSKYPSANRARDNLKFTLDKLLISYSAVKNRDGFNNIVNLLNTYFKRDSRTKSLIEQYRF